MKRENKNNIFIYSGTILFFLLLAGISIFMYMNNKEKTQSKQIGESIESEITEDVSNEMGKTVEEQKESMVVENKEQVEQNEETKTEDKSNETNKKLNNIKKENKAKDKKETKVDNNIKKDSNEKVKKGSESKTDIKFIRPIEGEIIGQFAKDNLIYSETLKEWITHTGIDIKADSTSIVKSSANGIIKSIVNDPRYGLTVTIEHDGGYKTVYSNLLTAEFVVEGEEVKEGQTIGTVGNTASFESGMESHLHFEILKDGEYLDPSIYLK